MKKRVDYVPQGVIPACLLPFHPDLTIDERSYRSHLRSVAAIDGVSAITVNAHASEVASCSFEEQRRVLDITTDEIGDRIPIVQGVYTDSSMGAARIAAMAHQGGASALLVFPPSIFMIGQRPAMVLEHFRRIADASDLPIIIFQYPHETGQGYALDLLIELTEKVPTIRALKDWSNDPQLHERHVRTLQSLPRPINVLSTHSAWLLSSLVLRCAGLLSGSGSVIADLQVGLFRAIQTDDMIAARAFADRIFPLASVFYSPPFVDMHNRMKEALVMLGKLPCAVVRPPLVKLDDNERLRIRRALEQSGLLATSKQMATEQ
jgi:4-hydroxy-tetrahydrodipicolinate synthase